MSLMILFDYSRTESYYNYFACTDFNYFLSISIRFFKAAIDFGSSALLALIKMPRGKAVKASPSVASDGDLEGYGKMYLPYLLVL